MALLNKKLTPAEIAAIHFHVYGNCQDWIHLYAIADGIKEKDLESINRSTVYKWKNSLKIVELIRDLERKKQDTLERAVNNALEQIKGDEGGSVRSDIENGPKRTKTVDYTDPSNQARKLNELVNTATDPGEALDALKVIMQAQKSDREAAREQKTVRAYLPLTCSECPFLEKARKRAEKR